MTEKKNETLGEFYEKMNKLPERVDLALKKLEVFGLGEADNYAPIFQNLNGVDLNTLVKTGFYSVTNAIKVPDINKKNGFLVIINSNNNSVLQLFFSDSNSKEFYVRSKPSASSFSKWEIFTTELASLEKPGYMSPEDKKEIQRNIDESKEKDEALIGLAHLADTGKDLVENTGKLLRNNKEVGVKVINSGYVYTLPETVNKARIFFKAQVVDPIEQNYIFIWVGDGQDTEQRWVSELNNYTRHYNVVLDLTNSKDVVISTVQAFNKDVLIWDFDWKEDL